MEKTALVVTVNQTVEKVFVRESTAAAITVARQWMDEDNQPGEEDMQRTMTTDGYYEYTGRDGIVTAFHITSADVA